MLKLPQQFWNLSRGDLPARSPALSLAHDVALAVTFAASAFGIRWSLGLLGHDVLIFAVCYPFLLVATLVAGLRAGLLTLVLTTLAFWFVFIPNYYSFSVPAPTQAMNVFLYVVVGAAVIGISEGYRKTYRKLQIEKARSELLVREMQHRSKNGLSVVSAIVMQTLKEDAEKARAINGRLAALSRGDELMWSNTTAPVPLRGLLELQLASYDPLRMTLQGPDATVGAELGRTLCLVVHELATNAVKYGAWSNPSGHVNIEWGPSTRPTYLRWSEVGGPPPPAASKPGFGTFLMGRLLTQHQGSLKTSRERECYEAIATFQE